MSVITAQIVIRFAEATQGSDSVASLLAQAGLSPAMAPETALATQVAAEAYFDLLERGAGKADHGLPFRYGASVRPEDFGALGLALKTAPTLAEALGRVVRYVAILTDSLDYELVQDRGKTSLVVRGRPPHRRGARIANEGALAAALSLLRQITVAPVAPTSVRFRHTRPETDTSVSCSRAFSPSSSSASR